MSKYAVIGFLVVIMFGCVCVGNDPVAVYGVSILPDGGVALAATATINATGTGEVTVKWVKQDYRKTSSDTVARQTIPTLGSGTYASTYNIAPDTLKGYYHVVVCENDQQLYATVPVFFGSTPPIISSFTCYPDAAQAPLHCNFKVEFLGYPANLKLFFGDVGYYESEMTSNSLSIGFNFSDPGVYNVVLHIENPWGKVVDTIVVSAY